MKTGWFISAFLPSVENLHLMIMQKKAMWVFGIKLMKMSIQLVEIPGANSWGQCKGYKDKHKSECIIDYILYNFIIEAI